MAETGCGDPGAVQGMAAELFDLASLLTGDEEQALRSIEQTLASMQVDPCLDPSTARTQARLGVMRTALRDLRLKAPIGTPDAAANPCVQDDDLGAAGVTTDQLRTWLGRQPQTELRTELRTWLGELPAAQRAVFVQRAVAGQSSQDAATLLNEAADGNGAWSAEQVSQTFRMALCSLANALAHAPAADALPA